VHEAVALGMMGWENFSDLDTMTVPTSLDVSPLLIFKSAVGIQTKLSRGNDFILLVFLFTLEIPGGCRWTSSELLKCTPYAP
jgi:hypothetical protein